MKLILVRHGESLWNRENRFTGWTDVDLTQKGVNEAKRCGRLLSKYDITFDITYTSYLRRAIKTAFYISEAATRLWTPVVKAWQLNERHYGALQGLNKEETIAEYGVEKVKEWRRSYNTRPPLVDIDDKRYPIYDNMYAGIPEKFIPRGESLKDTSERFLPYYKSIIEAELQKGQNVLIAAHGNSLRSLIMYLENLSQEAVVSREIPTGTPLIYDLAGDMTVIKSYTLSNKKQ
ncbi:MAG: 2,3-diphosphoglycerate-dependent phosphoglycerate mutase [Bacteroidales bacterium]